MKDKASAERHGDVSKKCGTNAQIDAGQISEKLAKVLVRRFSEASRSESVASLDELSGAFEARVDVGRGTEPVVTDAYVTLGDEEMAGTVLSHGLVARR